MDAPKHDKIPGWAVGVVVVMSTLVIVGGGIAIAWKLKKRADTKDSREENKETASDLKVLEKSGIKVSLPQSAIMGIANALQKAMDGYGTDDRAVYGQLAKINNEADWLAVQKAYGTRTISSGAWSPEPNFTGTLRESFINELNADQKIAANNLLARKGIKNRI